MVVFGPIKYQFTQRVGVKDGFPKVQRVSHRDHSPLKKWESAEIPGAAAFLRIASASTAAGSVFALGDMEGLMGLGGGWGEGSPDQVTSRLCE